MIMKDTNEYLSDKRVLFIAPIFHSYHTAIVQKLEMAGAEVIFAPERKYGIVFKVLNNFFPKRLKRYQEKHYRHILRNSSSQKFDYLLVVRGFMMPMGFLKEFRINNPGSKAIMYQWDSERTNRFSHLVAAFDRVCSFDFEDCENILNVHYLPLFYIDDVREAASKLNKQKIYDFFFMGWYFPERYAAILNFREYAQKQNWKLKAFLYMPFTTYIKERLRGVKIDHSIISFRQMGRKEYLSILCSSKVMVDVSNPNQTGLAMRIIEAFACGAKVLTNNKWLMQDKLYISSNVCFFDDKSPRIEDESLLNIPASPCAGVLPIEKWLRELITDTNNSLNI
jgi:hypothetical protein